MAQEKRRRGEAFNGVVERRWDESPTSPERFAVELRRSLPPDVLVCDDSITVRSALMGALDFDEPGSLVGGRGGSLGFGMGATLGMKLAAPHRPVVGIIGDGTAMFTFQALWTAVNYRIPVVYVICNNGSYKVLRENMARYLTGRERQSQVHRHGLLRPPAGFCRDGGVLRRSGVRVERPEELGPALEGGAGLRGATGHRRYSERRLRSGGHPGGLGPMVGGPLISTQVTTLWGIG